MFRRSLFLLLALFASALAAADWRESAQTAVHMLDYVGVDYPEFVKDGKVLNADEYKEQLEFTGEVVKRLQTLPENPQRTQLIDDAKALTALVTAKAPGEQVTAASAALRGKLVAAYALVVAPKQAPDIARASTLYAEQCAGCHGAQGKGDGPAGKGLEPAPSNFHDAARMNSRSIYGLYNTITLGVGGTGMAPYKSLSDSERWALAFYVSRFALSPADLARGETAWQSGPARQVFTGLEALVTLSTEEVRARYGADAAAAHQWLRANPQALADVKPSPIQFAIDALHKSVAAYGKGERAQAEQLAVTAYLEGFELVEASLDNLDADMRTEIERQMMAHRALLRGVAPIDAVRAATDRLIERLQLAQTKLEREGLSAGATFAASFIILLREGLEAILVLAAIITLLIKTGRRDALPWVHAGWAAALVLGVVTWFIATYTIAISGADREITEGWTALVAAAMLLYVGLWMHSKAYAQSWQRYIGQQVSGALQRRTLWAMSTVTFLAVYRELFEIVLFYQALWAQAGSAGEGPLVGGIGAAAALLAVIGWAIVRYGLRLPVGPFFAVTSILLAVLAVVFAGQGIAALQEAGAVDANPVAFIRIPALGIFPTAQTLVAQAFTAMLVGVGFYLTARRRSET